MAGLNRQVRGELDHLQGLRTAQNALSFSDHSNQDEKNDLGQESWHGTDPAQRHFDALKRMLDRNYANVEAVVPAKAGPTITGARCW